jgi:nitrate/nitrite transporter NarK
MLSRAQGAFLSVLAALVYALARAPGKLLTRRRGAAHIIAILLIIIIVLLVLIFLTI